VASAEGDNVEVLDCECADFEFPSMVGIEFEAFCGADAVAKGSPTTRASWCEGNAFRPYEE
jgi:hypothetical protein